MKFFLAIFIFFSSLGLWADSVTKSFFEDEIFFFMPKDVLKAYEGSWRGNQELFLKGKRLGEIRLINDNSFLGSSVLRGVGTSRMADEIIDTNSTIIVIDNTLYMMTKDNSNRDVIFKGYIKSNSVEWYRSEKIFAYNYTKDTFFKQDNSLIIKTYSVKPHINEGSMMMYLEYKGTLSKDLSPKVQLKIDTRSFDPTPLKL